MSPDTVNLEQVPEGTPASRPGPGGRLVLSIVAVLAVVVLGPRLLSRATGIDERERRIASIETAWEAHHGESDASGEHRAALERTLALRAVLSRSVDARSWRFGYRRATPSSPPRPPQNLRGEAKLDLGMIVLVWDPPEDSDSTVIYRSRRAGESTARLAEVYDPAGTWEDEIFGLSGTFTYELRSRRGEVESETASNAVQVPFAIPFEMRLESVMRLREEATIEVRPRPDGPRPRLFKPRSFVVRREEVVGAQVEWFDYGTGYVLKDIFENQTSVMEPTLVEVFTPEGARARDEKGKPLTRRMLFPRRTTRVHALLVKEGHPDVTLTLTE